MSKETSIISDGASEFNAMKPDWTRLIPADRRYFAALFGSVFGYLMRALACDWLDVAVKKNS